MVDSGDSPHRDPGTPESHLSAGCALLRNWDLAGAIRELSQASRKKIDTVEWEQSIRGAVIGMAILEERELPSSGVLAASALVPECAEKHLAAGRIIQALGDTLI